MGNITPDAFLFVVYCSFVEYSLLRYYNITFFTKMQYYISLFQAVLLILSNEYRKELIMNLSDTIFSEVVNKWFITKNDLALSTQTKYEQLIRNYITPFFMHYSCKEISDIILASFRKNLIEKKTKYQITLSNTNQRIILIILNQALDYGYNHQYFSQKFYIKPALPKSKPTVFVFSLTEQKKLETYIFSHFNNYTFAVLFALYTGMRIGEICALTWDDINFNNESVTVTKSVQRVKKCSSIGVKTELCIIAPKTQAAYRIIPIQASLMKYIKIYYQNNFKKNYIFSKKTEKLLDPRTLQYSYRDILKEADISYLNFHCLRHTFATRCVTLGWDMKTLCEILGHTDIRITMEYYFHSSFEYKKEQMNKLKFLS